MFMADILEKIGNKKKKEKIYSKCHFPEIIS